MKNPFSRRKLQGLETKRRLMACAIQLFREKGYHNVTVDEIIAAARSSKGAFYTHFKSKEELLYSLVALLDEAYLEFLDTDLRGLSAVTKILLFLEHVFKTMENGIGLEFMSVIYASQIKEISSHRFFITPQRKYYQILSQFIEEGKEKGEIQKDLTADSIIDLVTTGIRGVVYDWCVKRGEFKLDQYGCKFMMFLLQGIQVQ
jgi:TetR/AcrR family transcriptional regulator, fatty acid metabolism regulator protein